jgi:shikimate dehydrogenase
MARLGVLGWPVAHSRSPQIHNAAFAQLQMRDWHYQRLPVPPALFADTVRSLAASGFIGANVTIPHKQSALALADRASEAASAIGAANMLTFAADGTIAADNTDAPGLIAALGCSPSGLRALVLGAGGSARAAVWAQRREGASEVLIWNRTAARARALAAELGGRAVSRPEPADLLVNCTSVGLHAPVAGAAGAHDPPGDGRSAPLERSASQAAALNQLELTLDQVGRYRHVVDLVYRAGGTPLLNAARAHHVHAVDGLEVLVAQGALSFERWTGKPAPLEAMRRAARADDAGA